MKNVEMEQSGATLTIKIDLSKRFEKSASGKTTIIASTGGAVGLPGGEQVSLNVYVK